jgi:hypothetical protein
METIKIKREIMNKAKPKKCLVQTFENIALLHPVQFSTLEKKYLPY